MQIVPRIRSRVGRVALRRRLARANEDLRRRGVEFGEGTVIAPGSSITARTSIGDYTRINGPIHVAGARDVRIGKYCAFGWHIALISSNHEMTHANVQIHLQTELGLGRLVSETGPLEVGNNVWVGDRAIVLPGVTLGDGCVIGAGSVVTRDVPPFAVAVGNPAKVLKMRFSDDVIRTLLEIAWWNWPRDRIARNATFFGADLTSLTSREIADLVE